MATQLTLTITVNTDNENNVQSEMENALSAALESVKKGNTSDYQSHNHDEGDANYTEFNFDFKTK